MKRSLLVAALATMAAGSSLAQNVTIYGRLNVTAESEKVTGGSRTTNLNNNSSRIGFKGTEDLGGGLKAGFLIEHGFSPDTGTAAAAFWGRESNVYIEGSFGKVRLGNMGPTAAYFATADYISMHNHDTGSSSDAFYLYPGDARNMIAYTSPSFSGLVVEAQFGLKESTAGQKNTSVLAANYDAGPLHIGASYVSGGLPDSTEYGLRGLYEMGPITLGAYFIHNDIDALGVTTKRDSYRLSAMYAMGSGEFHANVGFAGKLKVAGTTVADTNATQLTLGYNHNLSKRTKLYGYYTAVNNKAAAGYGGSNAVSPAVGQDYSSLAVGIRHNF